MQSFLMVGHTHGMGVLPTMLADISSAYTWNNRTFCCEDATS